MTAAGAAAGVENEEDDEDEDEEVEVGMVAGFTFVVVPLLSQTPRPWSQQLVALWLQQKLPSSHGSTMASPSVRLESFSSKDAIID